MGKPWWPGARTWPPKRRRKQSTLAARLLKHTPHPPGCRSKTAGTPTTLRAARTARRRAWNRIPPGDRHTSKKKKTVFACIETSWRSHADAPPTPYSCARTVSTPLCSPPSSSWTGLKVLLSGQTIISPPIHPLTPPLLPSSGSLLPPSPSSCPPRTGPPPAPPDLPPSAGVITEEDRTFSGGGGGGGR